MRRVGIVVFFLCCFLLTILILQSKERLEEKYYVLPQAKSYVYQEGRRLSFEIYATQKGTILTYKESNQYQLICGGMVYTLEDIEIDCISQKDVELIIVSAKLPHLQDDFYSKQGQLKIINSKFEIDFEFGSLSILSPKNYQLLGVDDFYASYAYVDNVLQLVGINITFSKKYKKLSLLRIGDVGRGRLQQAQVNCKYENEVDIISILPNYKRYGNSSDIEFLSLEGTTYFIPIVYTDLLFIKQGYLIAELDDELYYLDTLSFIVNELSFSDYKGLMKKGVIRNA